MFTFNHFNFNVLDLARSVQFYHDALGLSRAHEGRVRRLVPARVSG